MLIARKELRYEGRAFARGEVLDPQPDERIADRLLRHGLAEEQPSGGVQAPQTQQPVVARPQPATVMGRRLVATRS